jgi:hypothetical protein
MRRLPSKPGKAKKPKKPMTKAQYKAYLHYLQTHRALDAQKKKQGIAAAAASKRGAVMPSFVAKSYGRDCTWVMGENDRIETCAMTALANHQVLTGISRPEDEEITAAGTGLSVTEALAYADDFGLGGHELAMWEMTDPEGTGHGAVIGFDTPYGPHTGLYLGRGIAVSWGRLIKLGSTKIDEAWMIGWR